MMVLFGALERRPAIVNRGEYDDFGDGPAHPLAARGPSPCPLPYSGSGPVQRSGVTSNEAITNRRSESYAAPNVKTHGS